MSRSLLCDRTMTCTWTGHVYDRFRSTEALPVVVTDNVVVVAADDYSVVLLPH